MDRNVTEVPKWIQFAIVTLAITAVALSAVIITHKERYKIRAVSSDYNSLLTNSSLYHLEIKQGVASGQTKRVADGVYTTDVIADNGTLIRNCYMTDLMKKNQRVEIQRIQALNQTNVPAFFWAQPKVL